MKIYNLIILMIMLLVVLTSYCKEIKADGFNINNIIGGIVLLIPTILAVIFQVIML